VIASSSHDQHRFYAARVGATPPLNARHSASLSVIEQSPRTTSRQCVFNSPLRRELLRNSLSALVLFEAKAKTEVGNSVVRAHA
jgi:hypothetical protein